MDIKGPLAEYMRGCGQDVSRVLNFYDDTESTGYCDTCYYEYAVVRVEYFDSNGERGLWVYRDSFADLIRDL